MYFVNGIVKLDNKALRLKIGSEDGELRALVKGSEKKHVYQTQRRSL